MSSRSVLKVHGPEALPDAAHELLNNPQLDLVHLVGFVGLASREAALAEVGKRLSPPISSLGEVAETTLAQAAEVGERWVFEQGDDIRMPLQDGFHQYRKRDGHIKMHLDDESGGYLPGPLTVSIALRGSALFFAAKQQSILQDGEFSLENFRRLRTEFSPQTSRRHWLANRKMFATVIQRPGDLVMFTNLPQPTAHSSLFTSHKRLAAIYDMRYNVRAPYDNGTASQEGLLMVDTLA